MKLKLSNWDKIAIFAMILVFLSSLVEFLVNKSYDDLKMAILSFCAAYIYAELSDYINSN